MQFIDKRLRSGGAHMANSAFEGTIGIFHLLLPFLVYEDFPYTNADGHYAIPAIDSAAPRQVLLGRFVGLLMICVALISWNAARNDKGVLLGLFFYHACASLVNATLGCGIDGTSSPLRDYAHMGIHGILAFCFLRLVHLATPRYNVYPALQAPWVVIDDSLVLNLVMKNFVSAVEALNEITALAERLNHHPDVTIKDYRLMNIVIRTHCRKDDSRDPTSLDLELASQLEKIPLRLSKKWLQDEGAASWATVKD